MDTKHSIYPSPTSVARSVKHCWLDWMERLYTGNDKYVISSSLHQPLILIVPWCTLVSFDGCILGVSPVVTLRNLEFEDDQKTHQQSQLQTLRSAHHDIAKLMVLIHNTFANDGPEVCAVFFSQSFSIGGIPSEMCPLF